MTACATGHGAENPPTVLRSASSAATCAEIKFYGVFVLNHRVVLAPDALVDFHTGRDLPNVCVRSVEDAARERGVVCGHKKKQRRGAGRRAPARDPGHARVAAQKLHGCGNVVRLAKPERDHVALREPCAREVEREHRAAEREQERQVVHRLNARRRVRVAEDDAGPLCGVVDRPVARDEALAPDVA